MESSPCKRSLRLSKNCCPTSSKQMRRCTLRQRWNQNSDQRNRTPMILGSYLTLILGSLTSSTSWETASLMWSNHLIGILSNMTSTKRNTSSTQSSSCHSGRTQKTGRKLIRWRVTSSSIKLKQRDFQTKSLRRSFVLSLRSVQKSSGMSLLKNTKKLLRKRFFWLQRLPSKHLTNCLGSLTNTTSRWSKFQRTLRSFQLSRK